MYIQNKLQEMLHRFVEENTLKVVVGVPIILLIFFLSFGQLSLKIEDLSITENSPDKIANINFKTLTVLERNVTQMDPLHTWLK